MYKFKKGDCVILESFRHLILDIKEENNNLYALVIPFTQIGQTKGKWILQRLLPLPIANIKIK
jgi:hypothetical protein